VKCAACGTDLSNPQQYCTKCGARLIPKPETPQPTQSNPAASRTIRLYQIVGQKNDQVVGQKNAVARLTAIYEFCGPRKIAADHILLVGPDGIGKRTIANAFATEMGVQVKHIDAATLERKGDLTAVLMSLGSADVLLIQDIGSLRPFLWQIFLTALQKNRIELAIGSGPGARKHLYQLNRFTCIATARRESDCALELREAFSLIVPMESYSRPELERLANLIATWNGVAIEQAAAKLIAGVCGGVPHQLDLMIKRLASLGGSPITEASAVEILSLLGVKASGGSELAPSGDVQQLTGIQFEELISSLLARMGFRAQMTKASGDGGIDIVADLDKPFVGGKYLIQCKRFSADTIVGAPVVREFYGAVSADRGAVKGVLVTTSGFSDQAREFAQSVGIELIDMDRLRMLLAETGMGTTDPMPPKPNLF